MAAPNMLPTPVNEAIKRSERRFLTASFLPVLIHMSAYVAVLLLATDSWVHFSQWWQRLSLSDQAIVGVVFASIVWFLASLLAANWRKIVRLYEGYPLKALADRLRMTDDQWIRIPGVAHHIHRQQDASAHHLYLRYAPARYVNQTLPTTIGNILLSAEQYGLDRYGFDTILLWPRLYWQLPDEVKVSIDTFNGGPSI